MDRHGPVGVTGTAPTARPGAPVSPPRRPRWRRWLRWTAVTLLGLTVVAAVAGALAWWRTPPVADAWQRVRAELARHHAPLLTRLPDPDRVGEAVIATEDSRFYRDPGVDPIGAVRALYGALVAHHDVGGATLAQQLAKRLYTPGHDGVLAQAEQVILAVKLDAQDSKQQILLMYLDDAYFGHGYYGVAAAARGYFGVSASALDWAQASLLAGLVQAPTAYDPLVHLDRARARQRHVLDRLVAVGTLTRAQADAAYAAPLHLRRA